MILKRKWLFPLYSIHGLAAHRSKYGVNLHTHWTYKEPTNKATFRRISGSICRKSNVLFLFQSQRVNITYLLQQNNKLGPWISNVENRCITYTKFILLTCFWTSASLSAIVICQLNNGLKTVNEAKCGNNFYRILLLCHSQRSNSRRSYDSGTAAHVKLHVIDVLLITKIKGIYEYRLLTN